MRSPSCVVEWSRNWLQGRRSRRWARSSRIPWVGSRPRLRAGTLGHCTDYAKLGWRNIRQVACTGSAGEYGDDGTCNEPTRPVGGSRTPSGDEWNVDPVTPMTSTKDSYNIYDIAEMIPDSPTSQKDERWLNCVQEAAD